MLYIYIIPKIVKIFKIVLNSYLFEYLVAWCILGEREFSWNWWMIVMWYFVGL